MRPAFPFSCLFVLATACGTSETRVEYEPYSGPPAYPDRTPKLPAPKGAFAYVSDNGSDTISVIDIPSNEVVAQAGVGRDPVGIDGPHHLAVARDGVVYVALSYPAPATVPGPHASHASSIRPGWVQKLAADDLRLLGEVQVDPNPGEIVLSPDGTRLIVTHFDLTRASDAKLDAEAQKASILVIDPATLTTAGSPLPRSIKACRAPHGASISNDGRTAFVACYADDTLAIVDLTEGASAPTTTVPVGSQGPYSAVLSPSGKLVAIGTTEGKATRIYDVEARAMRDVTVLAQGAAFFAGWSADDSKLWIPTQSPDALALVDAATGATTKQRVFDASCEKPHEATLAPDGGTLYVVCEGDHKAPGVVLALDPATLETRMSMRVGVYPDRFAVRASR